VKSSRVSPPQWNEVTAVFGGRFDPPHLGHREAVRGLFQEPGVKQVLIIPSASPPHKTTMASSEDRAKMAFLNFQYSSGDSFPSEVLLDRRELDRAILNPAVPSYTFDTLQELRQHYPKLAFVVGADQLDQLSTWNRFPGLLGLSHWIVLERKPVGGETARRTLQEWEASGLVSKANQSNTWQIRGSSSFLLLIPTKAPDISSTRIRESISRIGSPPPETLLPEVLGYLKVQRLYGM